MSHDFDGYGENKTFYPRIYLQPESLASPKKRMRFGSPLSVLEPLVGSLLHLDVSLPGEAKKGLWVASSSLLLQVLRILAALGDSWMNLLLKLNRPQHPVCWSLRDVKRIQKQARKGSPSLKA